MPALMLEEVKFSDRIVLYGSVSIDRAGSSDHNGGYACTFDSEIRCIRLTRVGNAAAGRPPVDIIVPLERVNWMRVKPRDAIEEPAVPVRAAK